MFETSLPFYVKYSFYILFIKLKWFVEKTNLNLIVAGIFSDL